MKFKAKGCATNTAARTAGVLSTLCTMYLLVHLGEIIATPTQRHAKHGSTLKEKLAFLSETMDFHEPNGSELAHTHARVLAPFII